LVSIELVGEGGIGLSVRHIINMPRGDTVKITAHALIINVVYKNGIIGKG
jgi:hypothetical protein